MFIPALLAIQALAILVEVRFAHQALQLILAVGALNCRRIINVMPIVAPAVGLCTKLQVDLQLVGKEAGGVATPMTHQN